MEKKPRRRSKSPQFAKDWFPDADKNREDYEKRLEEQNQSLTPDQDSVQKATEAMQNATGMSIDLGKVSDSGYLNEIFSDQYDSYKSAAYMKKIRSHLVNKLNYPDTPTLNTMVFLAVIVRRLQIVYQEHHVKMKQQQGNSRPEDLQLLKQIQDTSKLLGDLQKSMDLAILRRKEKEDVFSLHSEMLRNAEEYIEEHIGEFSFICSGCDSVVDAQGLQHWAIMTEESTDGTPHYYVFSAEMWEAVRVGKMSLNMMAFFLRTSVEMVLRTAKARSEPWDPKLTQQQIETEEHELVELRRVYEAKLEKEQKQKYEQVTA